MAGEAGGVGGGAVVGGGVGVEGGVGGRAGEEVGGAGVGAAAGGPGVGEGVAVGCLLGPLSTGVGGLWTEHFPNRWCSSSLWDILKSFPQSHCTTMVGCSRATREENCLQVET